MSKNYYFIVGILIILLGISIYFNFQKEGFFVGEENATKHTPLLTNKDSDIATEKSLENKFARNQECLKYKNEIVEKLKIETENFSFGEVSSLEQVFYSPKQNSCLYVEHMTSGGTYYKRLYDILSDGYSARPLEACFSFYPSKETMDVYQKMDGDLITYYEDLKACDDFDEKVMEYK